jgi:hypothetical protein
MNPEKMESAAEAAASSAGDPAALAGTASAAAPENANAALSADSTAGASLNDAFLNEDQVLALLENRDLAAAEIERVAKTGAMKSRKVRLAVAAHPRTPRRIALRVIRELYTFDLMQFSLLPTAAADLKRIADELLVARLASITLGERIALARRSSALVAGALLVDKESRVWQTALENPRVTEAAIVKALQRPQATAGFVEAVSHHAKWSLRSEIRIALLRSAHTPLGRALEFARRLPPALLRDVLHNSRLPEKVKALLRKDAEGRRG